MELGFEQYLRTMPMQTRNNPLEGMRTVTDSGSIVFLAVAVTTWIGTITYVSGTEKGSMSNLSVGINVSEYIALNQKINEIRQYTNGHIVPMIVAIGMVCSLIAMISVVVFLRILRYRTNGCTTAGFICTVFFVVGKPFHLYMQINYELQRPPDHGPFAGSFLSIAWNVLIIVYFMIAICCIVGPVRLDNIAVLIRNVMRALFSFVHVVFFGLIALALDVIIVCVSGRAIVSVYGNKALSLAILTTGIYLYNFIDCYVRAVIFQMTATWYWAEKNKARKPNHTTFRSIVTVTRYHLGSIALNATVIPPMCLAVVAAFTSKISANRSCFNRFVNIFFIPYLILYSKDYALAVTAMNGQTFYESTKTVFHTLTKSSPLSFAYVLMYVSTLCVVGLVVSVLSGLPVIVWSILRGSPGGFTMGIIISASSAFVILLISIVSDAIKAANLIYTIDNCKSTEKKRDPASSKRAQV